VADDSDPIVPQFCFSKLIADEVLVYAWHLKFWTDSCVCFFLSSLFKLKSGLYNLICDASSFIFRFFKSELPNQTAAFDGILCGHSLLLVVISLPKRLLFTPLFYCTLRVLTEWLLSFCNHVSKKIKPRYIVYYYPFNLYIYSYIFPHTPTALV
jgi:hypothetical protein